MSYKLDDWQKKVLQTKGNICLRSGRQVGKSFIIAIKAANYAISNAEKTVLIISKTEKQAQLLFSKILRNIMDENKDIIMIGTNRPTKHQIKLRNNSTILCLPAGETGYGIMGYTIDLLIADEAAFIPEEVWTSVIPTLAITKGNIWLLSTPFTKEGFYYRCFKDPNFTSFHQSSEDCPRKNQEFLDNQKKWMTKASYAQMYLGEFRDEMRRIFTEKLITACCTGKRRSEIIRGNRYFLGCDVARKDADEFTYEIIDAENREKLIQVESIITRDVPITSSARRIIELNRKYNFAKEYIDSGGMGITICDILRESEADKRKVVEINNASRPTAHFKNIKIGQAKGPEKQILKEELYENLISLMEQDKIILLDDEEVKSSLRSMQYEYPENNTGRIIISGSESHVTEGLIRAAWGYKDKTLNIKAFL